MKTMVAMARKVRVAMWRSAGTAACAATLCIAVAPPVWSQAGDDTAEIVIQAGHADIKAIAPLDADGRYVTGGPDGTLKVVGKDGAVWRTIQVCDYWIHSIVRLSRSEVAAGCGDHNVYVYDLQAGKLRSTLRGSATAKHLAFSARKRRLIAVSAQEVQAFDPSSGKSVWTRAVAGNKLGAQIISDDDCVAVAASTFQPRVSWVEARRLDDGAECGRWAFDGDMKGFAVSPNGKAIVAWGYLYQGNAGTWKIKSLQPDGAPYADQSFVWRGALDANGVLTALTRSSVVYLDAKTGRTVKPAIQFGENRSFVASEPGGVLYAYRAGEGDLRVGSINDPTATFAAAPQGTGIDSLSWSGDGYLALGLETGRVQLWDMRNGIPIQSIKMHDGPVHSLAFVNDNLSLVTGGFDDAVNTYEGRTRQVKTLLRIRPGGDSRSRDEWIDMKYHARQDVVPQGFLRAPTGLRVDDDPRPNTDELYRVSASSKGKFVAATGRGRFVKLVETSTGRTHELYSGDYSLTVEIPDTAFSSDETRLAVLYQDALRIYSTTPVVEQRRIPLDPGALSVAIAGSEDLKVVVGFRSGLIKVWDLDDGSLDFEHKAGSSISALAYYPRRNIVLAAGADSSIALLELTGTRTVRSLKGHTSAITSLAVHPVEPILASAGNDGAVLLWNLETETLLATLVTASETDWVVADRRGFFDGPTASWDRVRFRTKDRLFAPEQFARVFWQPGLLTETYTTGADIVKLLRERSDPRPDTSIADLADALPPAVAIAASRSDQSGKRLQEVSVTVVDAGSGARDLRVFRNGSVVLRQDGRVAPKQSVSIPMLAGANTITAYAFSEKGTRSTIATLAAKGPATSPVKPTLRLITVGIDAYAEKPLEYAKKDANAVLDAFRSAAAGRYAWWQDPLTDANATKARIEAAFRKVARESQPEDLFVFHFAGHGIRYNDQLHLLPHDYQAGGSDVPGYRTLSDQELQNLLAPIQASRIMVVIDACHSGQALQSADSRWGPMDARGLGQLAFEKGIYFVGASQGYQSALEHSRLGHGLLTYALVREGMQDMAADARPKDGNLFAEELLAYVETRVPQLQIDAVRARNLGYRPSTADREIVSSWVQRPKIYYPREFALNPLVLRAANPR